MQIFQTQIFHLVLLHVLLRHLIHYLRQVHFHSPGAQLRCSWRHPLVMILVKRYQIPEQMTLAINIDLLLYYHSYILKCNVAVLVVDDSIAGAFVMRFVGVLVEFDFNLGDALVATTPSLYLVLTHFVDIMFQHWRRLLDYQHLFVRNVVLGHAFHFHTHLYHVLYYCLRSLGAFLVLIINRRLNPLRQLKLEWYYIVPWHKIASREHETRTLILEDFPLFGPGNCYSFRSRMVALSHRYRF